MKRNIVALAASDVSAALLSAAAAAPLEVHVAWGGFRKIRRKGHKVGCYAENDLSWRGEGDLGNIIADFRDFKQRLERA